MVRTYFPVVRGTPVMVVDLRKPMGPNDLKEGPVSRALEDTNRTTQSDRDSWSPSTKRKERSTGK